MTGLYQGTASAGPQKFNTISAFSRCDMKASAGLKPSELEKGVLGTTEGHALMQGRGIPEIAQ
jgi:hypothetical protein